MTGVWIGVAVFALILLGGVVGLSARHRGSSRDAEEIVASTEIAAPDQSEVAEYQARVLVFETETPGQALVFGPDAELDSFGAVLSQIPRDLSHIATQSNALIQSAVDLGRSSGRLVLVDSQTASAIRSGKMMKDASGKMVAVVRNSKGQNEHFARLSSTAGKSAMTAASASAAMTAIALQAQLASIAEAIGDVLEVAQRVENKIDMGHDADLDALQQQVWEVFQISRSHGGVSQISWDQIDSLALRTKKAQSYRQSVMNNELKSLERLSNDKVKNRQAEIIAKTDSVAQAALLLREADRVRLRFEALRLWRLTTAASPELPDYVEAGQRELARQSERNELLLKRMETHLLGNLETNRRERVLHPYSRHKLQKRVLQIDASETWGMVRSRKFFSLEAAPQTGNPQDELDPSSCQPSD